MKRTLEGEILTNIVLEIFKLSGFLVHEGDILTHELGLSSARWKVLGALSLAMKPITVSDIARDMGLSRQAVQRLSNEMVKSDLLYSQENPNHKRARLFALTEKGKTVFEKLEQKQALWINGIADGLEPKYLELTLSSLKKIADQLILNTPRNKR